MLCAFKRGGRVQPQLWRYCCWSERAHSLTHSLRAQTQRNRTQHTQCELKRWQSALSAVGLNSLTVTSQNGLHFSNTALLRHEAGWWVWRKCAQLWPWITPRACPFIDIYRSARTLRIRPFCGCFHITSLMWTVNMIFFFLGTAGVFECWAHTLCTCI